mgnify:FL=1
MTTQTTETIRQQVIELASNLSDIPPDQILLDTQFATDLGLDSLDLAEFVMMVEDKFEIAVPDNEVETIKTVRDAVQAIQKLMV